MSSLTDEQGPTSEPYHFVVDGASALPSDGVTAQISLDTNDTFSIPSKEHAITPTVSTTSLDPSPTRTWETLALRAAPLAGLAALLVALMSILVCLGILLGARNAPIQSWKVQPSAYLAICTAVANQAVRFAAFQGTIIAWWYQALCGSTLRRLHADYRAGATVFGALSAGRNMGIIGEQIRVTILNFC